MHGSHRVPAPTALSPLGFSVVRLRPAWLVRAAIPSGTGKNIHMFSGRALADERGGEEKRIKVSFAHRYYAQNAHRHVQRTFGK